ncbi:hypothetical protein BIW11_11003, partial [Tropilaelaps mercedesae]
KSTYTKIPYLITWTIREDSHLRCITVSACDASLPNGSCLTQRTKGYDNSLPVFLDYYKSYHIIVYSIYDVGLNHTAARLQKIISCFTGVGPSSPVKNLVTGLNETGASIRVSWERPDLPNGPLIYYTINVTTLNGTLIQPPAIVSSTDYIVPINLNQTRNIGQFILTVTPVNFFQNKRIFGQPAKSFINFNSRGGPPTWLSLLVALTVLLISLWRSFAMAFFVLQGCGHLLT